MNDTDTTASSTTRTTNRKQQQPPLTFKEIRNAVLSLVLAFCTWLYFHLQDKQIKAALAALSPVCAPAAAAAAQSNSNNNSNNNKITVDGDVYEDAPEQLDE
jgi:hypothetical protein